MSCIFQVAALAMEDMLSWMEEGGQVGIFWFFVCYSLIRFLAINYFCWSAGWYL
jgi:hypothetical protein